MGQQCFDVIEVVLKKDLEIDLTPIEIENLSHIDEEVIEQVLLLVNNYVYLDDVVKLTDKIIKDSEELSSDEQENIKKKCYERIKQLKY